MSAKTSVKNYFVLFHVNFSVCHSKNSLCCVITITCKVGLVHEQNVRKHSVAIIVAIHKIAVFAYILYSVMGKTHFPSKFCVHY